jgi:hypothetical protein
VGWHILTSSSHFWIDSHLRFVQLPLSTCVLDSSAQHHTNFITRPKRNSKSQLHHPTMLPKWNIQPETQDGKSIDHLIVSLIFGKTVLPQRECGNLAVLTLSWTLPSLIGGKNVLPHRGHGNPAVSTLSSTSPSYQVDVNKSVKCNTKAGCQKTLHFEPLVDVSAVLTTPPSSNKSLYTDPI